MSASAPRPLHALTSLRFAAAALVVVGHSGPFGLPVQTWRPFDLRQPVSFFFILSGFILSYVYPSLPTWGARGRFLLARFARLWPAHLATFVLFCWLCRPPESSPPGVPDWLTGGLNLLLLHSWVPIHQVYVSWNGVSWSISTEFAFYLAFAALLPCWRRVWPAALAVALALAAGLITVALWAGLPEMGDFRAISPNADGLLYTHPLARLFEFFLGMAAARLWQRVEPRLQTGRTVGTLLELAALALAVAAMYYSSAAAEAAGRLPWPGEAGRIWLAPAGLAVVPFALLIAVLACERGWVSRLLAWRPFVLLGEISYAVYMLHPIPASWYHLHVTAFDEVPGWRVYLAYWVVVLLGSHLLWAGVERPLRAWIVGLWPAPGAPRRTARAGRSLWERLTTPGPVGLLAEAALLAAVVVPVLGRGMPGPAVRPLDLGAAAVLAQHCPTEARDARFGGRLALRGAEVARTTFGLRVKLAWQTLGGPPENLTVRVQGLGPGGELRWQCDRPAGPPAAGGALWLQKESLPAWTVGDSVNVAVSAFSPSATLPIDRGPRGYSGYALLLPLPR
jgi:peptidoglycan/LPS O-acetylase OafA/YrhL